MRGQKKSLVVVHEFSLIEDNSSEFTKINIIGKKISEIRVEEGFIEGDCIGSEAYYYICFEDGNILTLSSFDETLLLSYNAIIDVEGYEADTADCILTGEFAEKTFGRTVVSSTLCGKPFSHSMETIMDLMHCPKITMKLDNGVKIGFAIDCDTLYMGLGK